MNDSRRGAAPAQDAAPSWLKDFEQQSVATLLGQDNPKTRETLARLARLGIETVSDLLFHLPFMRLLQQLGDAIEGGQLAATAARLNRQWQENNGHDSSPQAEAGGE